MTIQTVDTNQLISSAVALPEVMPLINPNKVTETQHKRKPLQTRQGSQNGVYPESPIWHKKRPSNNDVTTQYHYAEEINYDEIITEDDEPVDNMPSEKQQRLLVEPLYSSRYLPRPFIATANVGLFEHPKKPAIVPDMLLSLGVSVGNDALDKENCSYFMWKYQKPPELVVEIVSNKTGNEAGAKFERYANLGVKYYVIMDIGNYAQDHVLNVYELQGDQYTPRDDFTLPDLGLSLTFWEGEFEDVEFPWIRWCDIYGNLILTGEERAEQEHARAEQERIAKEQANLEIERLRAKLRALGVRDD
ncbi:MAG: Uma2 family endonuclease [Chloroflexota bacterium]